MVKKWFSIIGKEIRGLHEAAYLLAGFAFLSQLLALVRDKLLAFTFGASHTLDIYYAAFRIPDFIFALVSSLVAASILLPFFIDRFERSHEEGRRFSDSVFTLFFIFISVVSIVICIFAPWLIPKVMPGFKGNSSLPDLILSMRIMLLSPFFLGLSNLFSSLTQMKHRFLVYAASPLVYNFGIIVGTIFLYPFMGISGLAVGVAIGAFLHMGIQIPFLIEGRLLPRFTMKFDWPRIRKIVLTSLPRTITLSANELAELILISAASLMTAGSISVFNLAFNLQSVPLSLIGASYASAVFPTLSRLYFDGHVKEFLEKMIASARHIIFWTVPITVLFIVLRAQIVRTILGAGKFNWTDTRLTAAVLAVFAISAVGQGLIVLFVRAFYAEGKTARPLFINLVSASTIMISGFTLIYYFNSEPSVRFFFENLLRVDSQSGTAVLMLGLAYSIGIAVSTILHWWTFERAYPGFTRPVFRTLFQSFSASVIMGYASFLSLRILAVAFPLNKVWGVFLQGLCSGLIGIAIGILVLIALKNVEIIEIWRTLHRKIWKAGIPPAEVVQI